MSFVEVNVYAAAENDRWDSYLFGRAYIGGAFSCSDGTQGASRSWWVDTTEGMWEVELMHIRGFDVGIYTVLIDGVPIGHVDGYAGPDIPNLRDRVGPAPVTAGRHKLTLRMDDTNPQSTSPAGKRWYAALHGLSMRRVGDIVQPVIEPPQTDITILPYFAAGHSAWDELVIESPASPPQVGVVTGFGVFTNAGERWWTLGLPEGPWYLDVIHTGAAVQVIIDGDLAAILPATTEPNHRTVVALEAIDGIGELRFAASARAGIRSLTLRGAAAASPAVVDFTAFAASGHTGWDTFYTNDGRYAYFGDVESNGSVGASRWWDLALGEGCWEVSMMHTTGLNRGIYSVRLDGTQFATLDGYQAGDGTRNVRTVLGQVQASGGTHRLALVMSGKHPASAAAYGTVTAIGLRRTS